MDKLKTFHQPGHHGFADPAQGQADHRDANLDAVYDLIQLLVETLNDARANASGCDELLDAVWDPGFVGDPSTVTVHIRRLREKVEPDPDRPTHVKAVWGMGYKFDPSVGA